MTIDKNLTVDLNRVQPLRVIKIHEGDTNSIRLVLSITKNNTSVDLSRLTVRYDAVIANTLAEQDAEGSVDGSRVIIPVTKNMTAKSGVLKIDVKLIEETSILFTQTISLTVERSIINEDITIDTSGLTINQKFDELNLKIEGLTSTFYTKSEIDEKLTGKEGFEYHQDATLEKCDEYTDPSTIYRLYIDGSYQNLICTSPTGCQYRFTRWGQIFYRVYDIGTSKWGEWQELSPVSEEDVITFVGEKLSSYYTKAESDNKLNSYYTKTQTDNLLGGKMNHIYVNSCSLEDCDKYTSWNTIYNLYIDGTYQILINSSANGCQYRFTRTGNIYFRIYNHGTEQWEEWKHITSVIPDKTIQGSMIAEDTIGYDCLADDYFRYFHGYNLDNIDNLEIGIYVGTASTAWQTKYGVTGSYVLLNTNSQILCFPESNMFFHRKRYASGTFGSWSNLDLCTSKDVEEKLNGEVGTIGENYAWYTQPNQGYSLTGTYSLVGEFCTINGTAPLIEGWETVYYSLPVGSLFSASTIAHCGGDTYSVVTNSIDNISVVEIRKIGGGAMSSGSISFTLRYRYSES